MDGTIREFAECLELERASRRLQATELESHLFEKLQERIMGAVTVLRSEIKDSIDASAAQMRAELMGKAYVPSNGGGGNGPFLDLGCSGLASKLELRGRKKS